MDDMLHGDLGDLLDYFSQFDIKQPRPAWTDPVTGDVYAFTGDIRQPRPGEYHFCNQLRPLPFVTGDVPHVCYIWEIVRAGDGAPPPWSKETIAALKVLRFPAGARPAPAEIRARFRELARQYHPDVAGSSQRALRNAQRLGEAKAVLKAARRWNDAEPGTTTGRRPPAA